MCGIVGFNWEDKDLLKKSLKEIKHRGPDYSGTFTNEAVSLGHNRLSIIDLSSAGNQPLFNENRDIWIVFNGEIYNFKDIRNKLKERHQFFSDSDTEVLLHLYEEEGINLVNKLQGMFAFCIYDSKKKILFLARDRLGKKPLYYYDLNGNFIFCSEIKGLLCYKEIKREVNLNALSSFLTFRANTQEETMFKNIKKLMPGHLLVYELKAKKSEIKKYWDLKFEQENKNLDYFSLKLRSLLEDSVKVRLVSDVPYGAYLSGGVDSGTIVSLMSKFSHQPVKTFSVGFKNQEHDETEEARFLAERLSTEHHELLIEEDSIKALPDIVYHADEPMADPTSIPVYFLSKYAKKYCTVILTGEGADEIFAGYPQYKFMKFHNLIIKKIPSLIKRELSLNLKIIPDSLLNKSFKFASALGDKGIERARDFINSNEPVKQYFSQISIFNEKEQSSLLSRKIEIYSKYSHYFQNSKPVVSNCQRLDIKEPLVEDLLMKVDKNTMAFSIEGRAPFLDYRVVELSSKIPDYLKLKILNRDKFILRKIVKGLIPEKTRKRKKKHFFVPIDNWFKNELIGLKEELLSENYISKQKIFNHDYIKNINSGFEKSKLYYSRQLWALIVFQIWYKLFIEESKIKI